jgi:short-subunit dehydrogenase
MRHLAGKVALITGASRGIGEALARALAAERMRLVLAARSAGELESLADELRAQGSTVLVQPTDVRDPAALAALVESAESELGAIDVLINNAGVLTVGAFHDLDDAAVIRTLDVNLVAPLRLTRLVLPGMLARGGGHIVNMASLAGRAPTPYLEAYAATKGGLISFTTTLRATYRARGVSASVIMPGLVHESGMYHRVQAQTQVRTPRVIGATTPARIAAATVRAIRRDLPEMYVNPLPPRPLLAFQALFPRLAERIAPLFGLNVYREAGQAYERRGERQWADNDRAAS